jgi:gamma-glutamyl-gamma-aminobutyrate hydrolase PuuD
MVQHIDGHATYQGHKLKVGNKVWDVTSAHHQHMIPAFKDWTEIYQSEDGVHEILVYPRMNKEMSFQPHPEYVGPYDDCQVLFFKMLKEQGMI